MNGFIILMRFYLKYNLSKLMFVEKACLTLGFVFLFAIMNKRGGCDGY